MATMRFCADIRDLVKIREFVVRASHACKADDRIIPDLELAADELCSNVITHGYDGQGGWIEITVQPVDQGVQLKIRDWGQSFDPASVPLPNIEAPLEERALGGLGLFLVQKLMDEVQFETSGGDGNVITVIKRSRAKEEG
jgi:serine/threonine-protein kinase RsbW